LKGEIRGEGNLIVGDTAVLDSDMSVGTIVISGEVHGTIVASEKIEIRAPGKVFGSIQSPLISMEEGVVFEGNCRMKKPAEKATEKVAVFQQ
jgi:cytoskeletal protein CcmA (bactofilin family)